MATWNPEANSIFLRAVEIEPPDELAVFLGQACGADAELRAQVEDLLQAHTAANDFLEQPAISPDAIAAAMPAGETCAEHPAGPASGTQIGPYKLLQKIGEGGMGSVWLAEQQYPVRRQVALKVIKPGMDSAQVLARFEAERQALALMDHPNIARVFDGGTTPTGQPFFVMELVKGVPITRYCDEHRLLPRERLELFVPVCKALQHAHQKGIIHRDIKPSNVLVAPYDGQPVVKVIDFGVAKATGQQLTERTLFTEIGAVVGTLEYMSPEQAELNNRDIDTRSDIYSLGVLLYELLTGTTPLDRARLKQAGFMEMLRIIREEEPLKPSTRLSESRDSLPSISAQRKTEPARLTKLMRGELDWIAMKALEKDRNRRYETANGLAMDVERYLADEPVAAGPPSARYRLGKIARKHRVALTAAAAFLALLVLGATISIWQAVRATNAERQAVANATAEGVQRRLAEANEQKARAAAAAEANAKQDALARKGEAEAAALAERLAKETALKAEQAARESEADTKTFSTFLVNDVLSVARPEGERGGLGIHVTVRQALKAAEEKIGDTFQGRPRAEAVARHDLGVTFHLIGERQQAEPHLRRAVALRKSVLGDDHEDTLDSQNSLAILLGDLGNYKEALPLHEKTLNLRKATLGPQHTDTVQSMNDLANDYLRAGRLDLALPMFEESFKRTKLNFGPEHENNIASLHNLAYAYQAAGKPHLALPLFEQSVELMKSKVGRDHPNTLASMANLAAAYQAEGKLDLALPILEEVLMVRKAKLGHDHPSTLDGMGSLANGYQAAGKMDLALPLYEEAQKLKKSKLGLDHPSTLVSTNDLATGYLSAGKPDLAFPLFEEAFKFQKAKLGPDHPEALTSMNNLAAAYWKAGKLDQSVPLFIEAFELQRARHGPDHPQTLSSMINLGVNYCDAGRLAEAVATGEEALVLTRAKLGSGHPQTLFAVSALAATYSRASAFAKAEPLYGELVAAERSKPELDRQALVALVAHLGICRLSQSKYTEAEVALREGLAIHEKIDPKGWATFQNKSLLAGSLLGQKKFAEAEPLLLQGYAGMKQIAIRNAFGNRPHMTEALERLVQLYEAWNKPDEASKWRKELEAARPGKPAEN